MSFVKFGCSHPLLPLLSCAYLRAKKPKRNTSAPTAALQFSRAATPPPANPTLAGVGKTILLVIWSASSSEEEIQLPTDPQSRAPVWPEAGCLRRMVPTGVQHLTPSSDPRHLYVTGRPTATVQVDVGGPLSPLPCSLGLPAGKNRGQSLRDTKTSLHGGGTQQIVLSDRDNNSFLYISGHLTNFSSSLR